MSPEIGTAALSKVADSFAKELFQSAKVVAAKSMGKFQAEFGLGFEKYVQRNQKKCRFVKTLLHRIDPIPIEQAYGEPSLKIAKEIILGSSFPEVLNKLKNIIVVGNGGSGKSMFLKKLFIELCEYVDVSSISNAKISKSRLAPRIAEFRSEILELDDAFRKKDRSRDSFVKGLLKKA